MPAPLVVLGLRILLPMILHRLAEKAVTKTKEVDMNEVVAGLVRHALTTVGGILVAKGYLDAGAVEALAGALVTIAGVVWSIVAKRKA